MSAALNVWSGGLTDTGCHIKARHNGVSGRIAVADNPELIGPEFFPNETDDLDHVISAHIEGLEPDTPYWYAPEVDSFTDMTMLGRFRTAGTLGEPFSFTFGAWTCTGQAPVSPLGGALLPDRLSSHPMLDQIRADLPLINFQGGDLHYYEISSGRFNLTGPPWEGYYHRAYDDALLGRQGRLFRAVPTAYMWDDHDSVGNDRLMIDYPEAAASAQSVYRERVPSYPLGRPSDGGVYFSTEIGRVLFLSSDVRSADNPNAAIPTMLGQEQKDWMEGVLSTSSARFLVWQMGRRWNGPWNAYPAERDELVQMFDDYGWLPRMCIISGDAHELAVQHGPDNLDGGFPVFQLAAMDGSFGGGGGIGSYTYGPFQPAGRGNHGMLRVQDFGNLIRVNCQVRYTG